MPGSATETGARASKRARIWSKLSPPVILSNVTFDLVVEHGMGHTSVVIAEQRARGLVCVQWGEVDPEDWAGSG